MKWQDVLGKNPIYLNLGGGNNCHPQVNYKNYISVDIRPAHIDWSIIHDLRKPITLPDNSVTRIHTEDFLEHLKVDDIKALLKESFRILKHGGTMRIGVPDYNNPKDYPYLIKRNDARCPNHITLTNYKLIKNIIEESPFAYNHKFYHYWDKGKFVYKKIDYSLGYIKRTPDNDERNKKSNHGLYVTSIVVDISKL